MIAIELGKVCAQCVDCYFSDTKKETNEWYVGLCVRRDKHVLADCESCSDWQKKTFWGKDA